LNGNALKWIEVAHTLKQDVTLKTREYIKAYDEAIKGISKPSNSLLGLQTIKLD
jgi:hypothetical protein